MASIMSLDCTAKERASSSTPKLGSRLKMSCSHQPSSNILISTDHTFPADGLGYMLAQVCLCAAPCCQVRYNDRRQGTRQGGLAWVVVAEQTDILEPSLQASQLRLSHARHDGKSEAFTDKGYLQLVHDVMVDGQLPVKHQGQVLLYLQES